MSGTLNRCRVTTLADFCAEIDKNLEHIVNGGTILATHTYPVGSDKLPFPISLFIRAGSVADCQLPRRRSRSEPDEEL